MIKLTIQHMIDYCTPGVLSRDDCLATLSQWMQEALQNGSDAQMAGKPAAAVKNLRQAVRCVAPLLRLAHHQPAALPSIIRLLQVTHTIAKGGIALDHEYDRDPAGYLSIAITCQIHLTRLCEWQQQTAQATNAISQPAPDVAPASPVAAPSPVPVAPPLSPATMQAPRTTDVPPHATISSEPKPITQRARWLAQRAQNASHKKKSA